MAFELASRGGWIDSHRCQFLVGQTSTRCALDFSAQSLDQLRWSFVRIHWMAAQARTIAAMQRFTRGCEKIDILARWLLRRASGPAKDSSRANAGVKDSLKAGIATHQGAIHCFGRRKKF